LLRGELLLDLTQQLHSGLQLGLGVGGFNLSLGVNKGREEEEARPQR
jgi:hypothetical protein